MHDELLERRLRTTLRDEANGLAFTITAAELERRAGLRSRGRTDRRLGLLLAAAVGIGLVGVGGVLSGRLNVLPDPSQAPDSTGPAPSASAAPTATPSASLRGPGALPSLDEMLAGVPADSVVIAQAHGPADGPEAPVEGAELGPMAVLLGELEGSDAFEVLVACFGEGRMTIDLAVPGGDRYLFVARATCDGAVHRATVSGNGPDEVYLVTDEAQASWRVVVRRLDGAPAGALPQAPLLQVAEGDEQLVWAHDRTIQPAEPGAPTPTVSGLRLENIGAVPARRGYTLQAWCQGGDVIHYIHGEDLEGGFVARTTTVVDCDGRVHSVVLGIPEPGGSRVYIAADLDTRWSILTSAEAPPVAIVDEQPGFQLSSGAGPDLSFSTTTMSFTGPGVEGGGQVLIVMDCAGSGSLEITIDLGAVAGERLESFVADCAEGGAVTGQTFTTDASYVTVTFPMPAGTWTAVSILTPVPAASP